MNVSEFYIIAMSLAVIGMVVSMITKRFMMVAIIALFLANFCLFIASDNIWVVICALLGLGCGIMAVRFNLRARRFAKAQEERANRPLPEQLTGRIETEDGVRELTWSLRGTTAEGLSNYTADFTFTQAEVAAVYNGSMVIDMVPGKSTVGIPMIVGRE